jgi:hypothetical protein
MVGNFVQTDILNLVGKWMPQLRPSQVLNELRRGVTVISNRVDDCPTFTLVHLIGTKPFFVID